MREKLEAMWKVFLPRVKALDDSNWTPTEKIAQWLCFISSVQPMLIVFRIVGNEELDFLPVLNNLRSLFFRIDGESFLPSTCLAATCIPFNHYSKFTTCGTSHFRYLLLGRKLDRTLSMKRR